VRLAYERPGLMFTICMTVLIKSKVLRPNVAVSLLTVLMPKRGGEIKNSIGMRLVKIHNCSGRQRLLGGEI